MTNQTNPTHAFRNALGTFATGVTIVTTCDAAGNPVGVTASSFNSVSLDPPLILWSLAKDSLSREAFGGSGHFAIHVLAASQEALSNRFARRGRERGRHQGRGGGGRATRARPSRATGGRGRTRRRRNIKVRA